MDEALSFPQKQERKYERIISSAISFLCWSSPFFGLGVFFPIGVLILYRINHNLRANAFQALVAQVLIYLICYPADLICMYDDQSKFCLAGFKNPISSFLPFVWAFIGLLILLFEASQIYKKYGTLSFFPDKWKIGREKDSIISILFKVFLSWFWAVFSFFIIAIIYLYIFYKDLALNSESLNVFFTNYFKGEGAIYLWFLSIYSSARIVGRRRVLSIFRKAFGSYNIHTRLVKPTTSFETIYFSKKSKYAKIKEAILPGWGQIYLLRYWQGFSAMFIYLLLLLFTATAVFFYIDYVFGIKFLQSVGLKPGIPDKEFIKYSDIIWIPMLFIGITVVCYIFSNIVLREFLKRDNEPILKRGLSHGFKFNIAFSVLLHFILLSLILIIPISLQRSSSKKKDMSKDHYQPEKMEFYFIDPDIPDEVKDLNGGVVSGTETPTETEGMKIPDEEVKDEGKVKGYVKKIKGKKLPKTYSNYISARMRGPELFMDYWRMAPHPYSSVVSYTITTDGEITDVMMVESSSYPDQDQLTLELVQSMNPVMPPPGVKGDVRVTELFWNGPIDQDAMPTQLQKDMVLMFDGRYMEEEF
jgi:TonB family protein